jgi:hypothetical protein
MSGRKSYQEIYDRHYQDPWITLSDDDERYSFLISNELSLDNVEELLENYTINEIHSGLNLDRYYMVKGAWRLTGNIWSMIWIIILSIPFAYLLFSGFVMNYMLFYHDDVYSCYVNFSSNIINVTTTLPDDYVYNYQSYKFSRFLYCQNEIHLIELQLIPICNRTLLHIQNLEATIHKGPNSSDIQLYHDTKMYYRNLRVFRLTTISEINNRRILMEVVATCLSWVMITPIVMVLNWRKYTILNTCIFCIKVGILKYKNRDKVRKKITIV